MEISTALRSALFLLGAFTLGSIPFGFLIGRLNHIDLRQQGSGNIGATNVWRVLGPKWGAPTFLLDFLKGLTPVLLVASLHPVTELHLPWLMIGAGLMAILGHNYTPWLGFKGGKGIATSAGVLAGVLPWSLLIVLAVWIILFLPWRIVSIASLGASVALPVATFFFYPAHPAFLIFSVFVGTLSIWRHRSNIDRILRGTEPSLCKKRVP